MMIQRRIQRVRPEAEKGITPQTPRPKEKGNTRKASKHIKSPTKEKITPRRGNPRNKRKKEPKQDSSNHAPIPIHNRLLRNPNHHLLHRRRRRPRRHGNQARGTPRIQTVRLQIRGSRLQPAAEDVVRDADPQGHAAQGEELAGPIAAAAEGGVGNLRGGLVGEDGVCGGGGGRQDVVLGEGVEAPVDACEE